MRDDIRKLCYITTCKGRLAHLKQTLPRVVGQPDVSCVVVDYSCPENTADWVAANYPQVQVVRVTGESGFNAAKARNFGARAANSPWLAFFDADIRWSPELANRVIPTLCAGNFYRPDPFTLTSYGSFIVHREDFDAVGGYDEAFNGWGGEDDEIMKALKRLGRTPAGFSAELIDEIPHDEATRLRFHDVKDRALQYSINLLYMQVKLDLTRVLNEPLTLIRRQQLFNEIRRILRKAADAGEPTATIPISLPITPEPTNGVVRKWPINRQMIYKVDVKTLAPNHKLTAEDR